jgi:hypothetical protein
VLKEIDGFAGLFLTAVDPSAAMKDSRTVFDRRPGAAG